MFHSNLSRNPEKCVAFIPLVMHSFSVFLPLLWMPKNLGCMTVSCSYIKILFCLNQIFYSYNLSESLYFHSQRRGEAGGLTNKENCWSGVGRVGRMNVCGSGWSESSLSNHNSGCRSSELHLSVKS